jgi:hypothetical protein
VERHLFSALLASFGRGWPRASRALLIFESNWRVMRILFKGAPVNWGAGAAADEHTLASFYGFIKFRLALRQSQLKNKLQ